MGVCGCGKSLIGARFAAALNGIFEDADDFHSVANKARMSAGIPLTDEDRWPWMRTLRARIEEMREKTPCYVLACSALKQSYRDILSGEGVLFLYLKGPRELIASRMAARKGHYMPTTLLDSQFAILEEPQDAIVADISGTPEEITAQALRMMGA
jgi:gluconokinase